MTKTLLDNALLLQAIAGTDGIDDRSFGSPLPKDIPKYHDLLTSLENPKDLSGVKIGIITESLSMPGMDPRVRESFLKSVARFKELGAVIEEVSIPMHTHGATIWTGISKAGGAAAKMGMAFGRRGFQLNDLSEKLWPMTQEKWDAAYPSTKNIYLNGLYARSTFPSLLGQATNLSLKLKQDYDAGLEKYTVLALPNLPYIANSHAPTSFAESSKDNPALPLDLIGKQVGLTANTAPFNQSGHPVLAMPSGMLEIEEGPLKGTGTKLPVSMQIVGRWHKDEDVYRVAYAWESANDWKQM